MKEKIKDGLTTAKEKVGDFWDEYGLHVTITALSLGGYGLGLYLGYKLACANIETGLNLVMLKYPDRPIKELKQASLDVLNEIKDLHA